MDNFTCILNVPIIIIATESILSIEILVGTILLASYMTLYMHTHTVIPHRVIRVKLGKMEGSYTPFQSLP